MNSVLKLSQLNGLISDIFEGLGNYFNNIFSALFSWLVMMFYQLVIAPLLLIMSIIQMLFKVLAGIDNFGVEGEVRSGDIGLALIENPTVQNIFWSLVILAVVLLFLTTIVALIKSETALSDEKPKNKQAIFARAIKALVSFFMVPAVAILGVMVGNALLNSLDKATSASGTSIAGVVFKACASECNRARNSAEYAAAIASGYNDMGLFEGNRSNADTEYVAGKIDEAFATSTYFKSEQAISLDNFSSLFTKTDGAFAFETSLGVFSLDTITASRTHFSMYDAAQVFYYYDLMDFNFLLAIIVSLFVCYVLFITSLGLVKRIYKIVTLLCISPAIASLYPLDDGNALKEWRKNFVGTTLSAYSTVVVLNIMLVLIGPLTKFDLFPHVTNVIAGIPLSLLNNVASLLIICGGFAFFKELSGDIAKIIGAENAYEQGGKVADGLAKTAGKAVGASLGFVGGKINMLQKRHARKSANKEGKEADRIAKENGIDTSKENIDRLKKTDPSKLTAAERQFLHHHEKQEKHLAAKDKYQELAKQRLSNARYNALSAATGGLTNSFATSAGFVSPKRDEIMRKRIDDAKASIQGHKGYYKTNKIAQKVNRKEMKEYNERIDNKSGDVVKDLHTHGKFDRETTKGIIGNIDNSVKQMLDNENSSADAIIAAKESKARLTRINQEITENDIANGKLTKAEVKREKEEAERQKAKKDKEYEKRKQEEAKKNKQK